MTLRVMHFAGVLMKRVLPFLHPSPNLGNSLLRTNLSNSCKCWPLKIEKKMYKISVFLKNNLWSERIYILISLSDHVVLNVFRRLATACRLSGPRLSLHAYSGRGPITIKDNRVHDSPRSTVANPVQTLWELLEKV